MRNGLSIAVRALVASAVLATAAPAAAAAGSGIRLGGSEGRLHPFLDVEERYDSNVFYSADGEAIGDHVVHVRPGLELLVPGERTAVQFSGNLDWARYLGIDDPATEDLSKLYGQAALALKLNRRGAVGLEVNDAFRRNPSSATLLFGSAVVSNMNVLDVRVPWRPGGGALVVALTGGWTLETFEPYLDDPICDPVDPLCDPDALAELGYDELRAGLDVRWRFLPRTSAVLEAGFFSRAPHETALSEDVSGVVVQAGLTGLVTPRVGGTVRLGYGDTLGSAGEDFRTWAALVEAEWNATENASARLGYVHALGVDPGTARAGVSAPLGGVYASSRAYAGGKLVLARRYALRADVQWERRSYDLAPGDPAFDLLRVVPTFEAAITRWLKASVGYAYTDRAWAGDRSAAGYAYTKHETWLRIATTY